MNSKGAFALTLAWLAASASLGGCAAIFDIERAEGLRSTPGDGDGSLAPNSVVSPNQAVPEEEAPESQPEPAPDEPAPSEPAPSEPESPKEVEIPAASNSVVPGAAEYLPRIDGLTNFSVEHLSAIGSTLTTSLVLGRGICVEGTSTLLYDDAGKPDYIRGWGASLKLYTGGWRPGDFGVQGLSFNLVGDVPPLRFQGFSRSETAYCEALTEGVSSVLFSDLQRECYNNVESNPHFSEPVLAAFEWQIFSSTEGPKSFDFCIEGITPILDDVPPAPEPGIAHDAGAGPDAGASPDEGAAPDTEEDWQAF